MKNKQKEIERKIMEVFDDGSELLIESDEDGLLRIKGHAILSDCHLNVSLQRRSEEDLTSADAKPLKVKPLYSGTVSMISPEDGKVLLSEAKRRSKEAKGKAYLNKDIYASNHIRCNSTNIDTIAGKLRLEADKLLLANKEQYMQMSLKFMSPDKLTPHIAMNMYVNDFINLVYGSSPPERNDKRKRDIKRVFSMLPNKPMHIIKQREIKAIIEQHHIVAEVVNLGYLFWDYLIQYKKCRGKNPFPDRSTREASLETKNKRAFNTQEFSDDIFEKMITLINRSLNSIYCVLVLMLSGFTWEDILPLTWGDIEFVKKYTDFSIIHIRKDRIAVSKHDFSRPAIPDAALYLKRVYDKLCREHGEETVKGWHIASDEQDRSKKLDRESISEKANNMLVLAGFQESLSLYGRPGSREPIPLTLLRTNYERKLKSKCGLSDDPDTYHFLAGLMYKSSTFVNYESHTSPEAQYRLYTILKPFSVKKAITKPKELKKKNGSQIFTAAPKNNHEVTRVIGKIHVKHGDRIVIRCAHGVWGRISG